MKLLCTRGAPYEYTDPASGEQFYSCSQVLKVMDPDLYRGIDEAILEVASARGVDLHKLFFYSLASRVIPSVKRPERPAEFGGYFDAIQQFIADYAPVPKLLEEASVNRKWGVAGRPDAKLLIAGKLDLTDLKTTRAKHRTHAAQLNIYKTFEEYADVQTMHILYIHEDGTYEYLPVYHEPLHLAGAENAINVLRWRAYA